MITLPPASLARCTLPQLLRAFALLLLPLTVVPARAGGVRCQVPCDCSLRPSEGALGYAPRPGRCEGKYAEPIADPGLGIALASLTRGGVAFDVDSKRPIAVAWARVDRRVHVRAQPITSYVFYRMDAEALPTTNKFDWPVDVLKRASIEPSQIGATAWITEGGNQILVPIRLCQLDSCGDATGYQLMVVPAYAAVEMKLEARDATSGAVIHTESQKGLFPREEGVPFQVPEMGGPRTVKLNVEARWRKGGRKIRDFAFQTR